MKNANQFALGVILAAGALTLSAAQTQYLYSGQDTQPGYANVQYRITITETGAGFKVAGSVYDGRGGSPIDGAGAGNGFAAQANYTNGYQTVTIMIYGQLNGGTMGTGTIGVYSPSPILFNGQFVPIYATLYPVPAPSNPPTPKPPVLPTNVHMSGGAGFGYTTVTISLNNTLKGSAYEVSGTILVKTEILKQGAAPSYVETTLVVSGLLTPGVEGSLTLSGVPAGNNPSFTGTIAASGTAFSSLLSGLPTLGITGLYLNAEQ
jgi:hypothetical protein